MSLGRHPASSSVCVETVDLIDLAEAFLAGRAGFETSATGNAHFVSVSEHLPVSYTGGARLTSLIRIGLVYERR